MGKKEAELEKKLSGLEGRVLIVDHEGSDPDGTGSKYGMSFILKNKFNLESDIACSGRLDHLSLGMEKKLDGHYPPAKPIDTISLDDYAAVILLDCQPNSDTQPFTAAQLKNLDYGKLIVIDHHEKQTNGNEYLFEDITEKGICSVSTRIMEYLKAFKIELDKDDEEHQLLATALVVGQKIDARSEPMTSRDALALAYVLDHRKPAIEREMERSVVSPEGNIFIGQALKDAKIFGVYAIADGGELSENDRPAKAIAADGLMRIQGVTASIVWGWIYENGVYSPEGSVRVNDSHNTTASKIAEKFGGKGREYAGGFTFNTGSFGPFTKKSKDKFTDRIHESIISIATGKKEDEE